MSKIAGQAVQSAYHTPILRINPQGRNCPHQSPTTGLPNQRIRSRLRAIYPYPLGVAALAQRPCKGVFHAVMAPEDFGTYREGRNAKYAQ